MSDTKAALLRAARTAIQMAISAATVWLLALVPQLAAWGLDEGARPLRLGGTRRHCPG